MSLPKEIKEVIKATIFFKEIFLRLFNLIFGVLIPVMVFLLSGGDTFKPSYKIDSPNGFSELFVVSNQLLLPLVIWASIAFICLQVIRVKNMKNWQRIGLWSGVFASLFSIIAGMLSSDVAETWESYLFSLIDEPLSFFSEPLAIIMVYAPFYVFFWYLYLCLKRIKKNGKRTLKGVVPAALITSPFIISAIAWAYDIYKDLPYEPTGKGDGSCYVVSASQYAYPTLVGPVFFTSRGKISHQLLLIKALEFFWNNKSKRSHMIFRKYYNKLGPIIAGKIKRNQFLASIVYLLLKPVEFLALIILQTSSFIERSKFI